MLNFAVRRRLEREFESGIMRIYRRILQKASTLTWNQLMAYLKSISLSQAVAKLAENLARRMVTLSRVQNMRDWRAAARQGSMGREIYKALRNEMSGALDLTANSIVKENAKLISSVPREVAERVTKDMLDRYQSGLRYEDYVPELMKKVPTLMRDRAKLIARTEAAKANEAMTEVRSRNLGINCYIWRSSHDERVRHTHDMMDGALVFWDYPPDPEAFFGKGSQFGPYHAGCCPNCRCYCEPVVDMQWLPDRLQVSANGQKPVSMTRREIIERWGDAGA